MNPRWLYISFVGERGFIGAVIVQERQHSELVTPSWQIEGLPKWAAKFTQILIVEMPPGTVPADHRYHGRLLNRKEIDEAMGGTVSIGDWKKENLPN